MAQRLPTHDEAQAALEAYSEAREVFITTFYTWLGALDTTPLTEAYQALNEKAETLSEQLYDLKVDYEAYSEARSARWAESDRGREVIEIFNDLERYRFTLDDLESISVDVTLREDRFVVCAEDVGQVEDMIPDAPELPEEVDA